MQIFPAWQVVKSSHRRSRFVSLLLLVAGSVAIATTGHRHCPACVSSNANLPLATIFRYSPGAGLPGGESVPLSGRVHVVTEVNPTTSVGNLHLNLAGLSGVGQSSGDLYIGLGTNEQVGVTVASGPNVFTSTFTLEPTDGCASVPLPVKFTLNFNGDGTLNAATSSATVGGVR